MARRRAFAGENAYQARWVDWLGLHRVEPEHYEPGGLTRKDVSGEGDDSCV